MLELRLALLHNLRIHVFVLNKSGHFTCFCTLVLLIFSSCRAACLLVMTVFVKLTKTVQKKKKKSSFANLAAPSQGTAVKLSCWAATTAVEQEIFPQQVNNLSFLLCQFLSKKLISSEIFSFVSSQILRKRYSQTLAIFFIPSRDFFPFCVSNLTQDKQKISDSRD